jgi:hypothetical protein
MDVVAFRLRVGLAAYVNLDLFLISFAYCASIGLIYCGVVIFNPNTGIFFLILDVKSGVCQKAFMMGVFVLRLYMNLHLDVGISCFRVMATIYVML